MHPDIRSLALSQVQGSGASGGGLALYQVAAATISGDIYNANVANTGGGGVGATGYNSSSLLIQDTRHGAVFRDGPAFLRYDVACA